MNHTEASDGTARFADRLICDWKQALDAGAIAVLAGVAPLDIEGARVLCRNLSDAIHQLVGERIFCSRSATAGQMAIAMCRSRPIGVDVEAVRPAWIDVDLLDMALSPGELQQLPVDFEARFFGLWTRKEAVLKAVGTGFALQPRIIDVGWHPGWRAIAVPGGVVHARELAAPATAAMGVASLGKRVPVCLWNWNTAAWPACRAKSRRGAPSFSSPGSFVAYREALRSDRSASFLNGVLERIGGLRGRVRESGPAG